MKLALALVGWMLLSAAAGAAPLDDYLAAGYRIVRATTLPGSFAGCTPQQRLTFADRSSFVCREKTSQLGFDPPVAILATPGGAPSVVLIGGRAYRGNLTRLGDRTFGQPLPTLNDPPGGVAPATADRHRLPAILPMQSINELSAAGSKRLNDVQADSIPGDQRDHKAEALRGPRPW